MTMPSRRKFIPLASRQRGALTMFSAVLILILLTELILYATQVGIFEQRKSSNDMRQKQAFHAADAGLQQAKEFFLANVLELSYKEEGGWLHDASLRWELCPSSPDPEHPCSGEVLRDEPDIYGNTYFYSPTDADLARLDSNGNPMLPLDESLLNLAGMRERVDVYALLCVLELDRSQAPTAPVVQGCLPVGEMGQYDHVYFMLTLMARGQADCQDTADPTTCSAEALVVERMGSYGPSAGDGPPGVPLTTRSSFPPGGTAELVPNPNGGGVGVPLSAWINGRQEGDLCDGQLVPVDPDGASWSTCEAHEWYGVPAMPDEFSPNGAFACPEAACECDSGGMSERQISYSVRGTQILGMDIVVDEEFPCDLFASTFGVPKSAENFWDMAGSIGEVIDSCNQLGPDSKGVYWMIGDTCSLNANAVVGSPEFPVFLISAANLTRMNGGGSLFGIVFVTDVLGNDAVFESIGGWTTYGAIVVDAELGKYSGTFQIVYVDQVLRLAADSGGIGEVAGGWTDAPPFWRFRGQ
jgi:hypothetical protein